MPFLSINHSPSGIFRILPQKPQHNFEKLLRSLWVIHNHRLRVSLSALPEDNNGFKEPVHTKGRPNWTIPKLSTGHTRTRLSSSKLINRRNSIKNYSHDGDKGTACLLLIIPLIFCLQFCWACQMSLLRKSGLSRQAISVGLMVHFGVRNYNANIQNLKAFSKEKGLIL